MSEKDIEQQPKEVETIQETVNKEEEIPFEEIKPKLLKLGAYYLDLMADKAELEERRYVVKCQIENIMNKYKLDESFGLSEEGKGISFKMQQRSATIFDKSKYSNRFNVSKDYCDYIGISKMVEESRTNSEEIAECHYISHSKFVLVKSK